MTKKAKIFMTIATFFGSGLSPKAPGTCGSLAALPFGALLLWLGGSSLLLLGAVVCAALFNILSRSEAKKFTPAERTYMMFAVGTVGFNIIAITVLKDKFSEELLKAAKSPEFWGATTYLAILSSIVAFLMYNWATTKIDAIRASSFSNVITVVSVLAGIVILGEKLSLLQLVFCVLIIIGVYGANKVKKC